MILIRIKSKKNKFYYSFSISEKDHSIFFVNACLRVCTPALKFYNSMLSCRKCETKEPPGNHLESPVVDNLSIE